MNESIKKRAKTFKNLLCIISVYTVLMLMDHWSDHQHNYTLCIFKNITSIPCPGCGMGRGTLALFKGNIAEAFSYNIICIPFTICVFLAIIWLTYDLTKGEDTFFKTINQPIKPLYLLPFFIITAISWTINIIRGI